MIWRYRLPATLAGIQALLIGLKVSGVTRWTWWLVLAPVLLIAAVYAGYLGLVMVALSRWGKRSAAGHPPESKSPWR
jgi:hypothetical protein